MNNARLYKYDVFISYSSKDRIVAEGICGYLEANGLRCFIDYRDIPHGAFWARVLPKAIDCSRVMVAVFSSNYNKSLQVERELSLTDKMAMPILPFRLSDTPYEACKSYYFQSLHWIDAFPEPEKVFGALLEDVRAILDGTSRQNVSPARSGSGPQMPEPQPEIPAIGGAADAEYADDYEDGVDAMNNLEYSEAMRYLLEPALAGYDDARHLMRWMLRGSYIMMAPDGFWQRVREAADDEENAFAQCMMSRYHGFVDLDHNQAYEYAARSARAGNLYGRIELAMLYSFGAGVPRDGKRFFSEATCLARMDFAQAMWILAREYIYGNVIPANPRRGMRLLERGAELGYAECVYELGRQYVIGRCVPRDTDRGIDYLRLALDAGYPEALDALARALLLVFPQSELTDDEDRRREGLALIDKGVRFNIPQCISTLADIYEIRARQGEKIDPSLTLRWRIKGAELCDRYSMDKLIYHYHQSGNYAEAWRWASRSAKLGGNLGEYFMGEMAVRGQSPEGVTAAEGIEHLENALFVGGAGAGRSAYTLFCIFAPDDFRRGFPTPKLERLAVEGVEPDEARTLATLRRGAECGSTGCSYLYGCALTDISRPYANEIEGMAWLRKAADAGHADAATRLKQLARRGIGL